MTVLCCAYLLCSIVYIYMSSSLSRLSLFLTLSRNKVVIIQGPIDWISRDFDPKSQHYYCEELRSKLT